MTDEGTFPPEPELDGHEIDRDDPTYKVWREVRGDLQAGREPGLIDVHRYHLQRAGTGIPTFLDRPIALTPADLKAANVDIAMLGAGLDASFGMRGAAYGPRAIRSGEMYLPSATMEAPHLHVMVDAFQELVMADYGDAAIDIESTEQSIHPIRALVREVAETGTKPFIIGGDHSLMYPDVAGLSDVYGKGNIGVIHFDSHYDAASFGLGHWLTHGNPVRRLIQQGHVKAENFIQVGLRGFFPHGEDLKWMRDHGMRFHFMTEVEKHGWDHVLERALKEAREGADYLYISLDIDVLDPAYAPGTGTPEPGGLTTRELFPLLRRLTAENDVVGMELVEVNPLVDPTYLTTMTAIRCMREMVTGVALRKKGITERHYLSPDTLDHGQG